MFEMQTARIAAAHQPRRTKLPPLIPDSCAIGVFYVLQAADISCPLQGKLQKPEKVFSKTGNVEEVPQHSRFLRRSATTSPFSLTGVLQEGDDCFEVAFGLPWSVEAFIAKAVQLGHPANFCKLVGTFKMQWTFM